MFTNNFKKGYQAGQTDAEKGKGKRIVFRPLQRAFQPDVFLRDFDARFSEYWQAYTKGYEDTHRVHNVKAYKKRKSNTVKENPESPSEAPKKSPDKIDTSDIDKVIQQTQRQTNQTLNTSSGGTSMSNPNIDQQIQILQSLKARLDTVRNELINANTSYKNAVIEAYQAGLLLDFHTELDATMQQTNSVIKNSADSIEMNDKKQIEHMIQKWDDMR